MRWFLFTGAMANSNPRPELYRWVKLETTLTLDELVNENQEIASVALAGKHYCIGYYQGAYYAFDKNCPHAGAGLDMGWINAEGCVVCPHHRYTYQLTDGKEVTGQGVRLNTYPVEQRTDGIYIGLRRRKWFNWW